MRWARLDVSSTNRPDLLPEERVLLVQASIGLYEGGEKVQRHQDGAVYLTTHRICYIDRALPKKHAVCLQLRDVAHQELAAGFLKQSPKLTLTLKEETREEPALSTWICPICYFANPLPAHYSPLLPPPPCLTCGMKPDPSVLAPQVVAPDSAANQASCPRCTFHNHPSLTVCEICGERLHAKNLPPVLSPKVSSSPASVKLSFHNGGERSFADRVRSAREAREWQTLHAEVGASSTMGSGAGITGLERAGDVRRRKNELVLGGAFEDLEALMARAKEMVALAESFAAQLHSKTGATTTTTSDPSAQTTLAASARALGLSDPGVTHDMAGDSFHAELARQIADFLDRGVLEREGGVITLTDVFCLYNRARGMGLISPHDLYQATQLFHALHLPMRMRRFRSGLAVVQRAERREEAVVKMVLAFVTEAGGASAREMAGRFGWSVGIAAEELELAEVQGVVCRDTAVGGTRFYPNLISRPVS